MVVVRNKSFDFPLIHVLDQNNKSSSPVLGKPRSQQKRVRFSLQNNHVFYQDTSESVLQSWYSPQQFEKFKALRIQEWRRVSRESKTTGSQALSHVYDECTKLEEENDAKSVQPSSSLYNEMHQFFREGFNTGLVRAASCKIFRDQKPRRARVVDAVLSIQETSSGFTMEANLAAIQSASFHFSRPSVVFAHHLAVASVVIDDSSERPQTPCLQLTRNPSSCKETDSKI